MTTAMDGRLERLYQQVVLVRGVGDRKRGKLCIMSFVAFLTGEGHTDNPSTASRLIRRFAMAINDEMPDRQRQRLKSFAPRLIGTRDGQDQARAQLLLDAARTEIFPRIVEDFGRFMTETAWVPGDEWGSRRPGGLQELAGKLVYLGSSKGRLTNALPGEDIASTLAQLLAYCAKAAAPSLGDWYWLKAIELFDRLCDVGGEQARPELRPEQLMSVEAFLDRRSEVQHRKTRTVATLARVRSLLPAFMR